MVREKTTPTATLVYVVILTILYFLPIDIKSVALGGGNPFAHVLYQNFHGSIFHLLCNVWVLLSFVFNANIHWSKLLFAYILSATYPVELLPPTLPIIGLSGMLYVLLGWYALNPPTIMGKLRYQLYVAIFLLVGLLYPNVCVGIHLYCYALGLIFAVINYPFINDKPNEKSN